MSVFFCDSSQLQLSRINDLCALKFLQRIRAGAAYTTQDFERKPNIHPSKNSYLENQSEFHLESLKTPKCYVLYKSRWQVHRDGNIVSPSGNPLKLVASNPIKGANKCKRKNP